MRTATRWALPVTLAAGLVGGTLLVPSIANADPDLPPTTAEELLADLAQASLQPFSGTVVRTVDLGLPELPASTGGSPLTSLVAGSTTIRLWYASPEQARLAVLGTLAETDVVRNGTDLYVWSSGSNTARHTLLPEHDDGAPPTGPPAPAGPGAASPAEAARSLLAAIEPTTKVTLDGTATVAGRDAYELVLEPRGTGTLVGQVRLAVDAVTSFPLRVQVSARGAAAPGYENGFTSVTFATPGDEVFAFSPPPGATVTEIDPQALDPQALDPQAMDPEPGGGARRPPEGGDLAPRGWRPVVLGQGWTAVLVRPEVDLAALTGTAGQDGGDGVAAALLGAFQPVSGDYGTGRVLRTSLLSVLVLDDGRALVGAVPPAALEQAALDPAAAAPAPAR